MDFRMSFAYLTAWTVPSQKLGPITCENSRQEKKFHESVLNFLHSNTGCSKHSPLHVRQTSPRHKSFLSHLPAVPHLKHCCSWMRLLYSEPDTRHAVTSLNDWKTLYQQQPWMIHSESLSARADKLPNAKAWSWPPRFWFKTRWHLFVAKCIKQISTLWKN